MKPRNAEFIPPQHRSIQEHRNNLNAFNKVTLKRHECRTPFTRFKEWENLLKMEANCDHESVRGRAVLPHSLNIKAARQRRPTDVVTWFMESISRWIRCHNRKRLSDWILSYTV